MRAKGKRGETTRIRHDPTYPEIEGTFLINIHHI